MVACSASKITLGPGERAPAEDLYSASDLFQKAAAVASTADEWVILSAKHGLVLPHQLLENYSMRLPRGGSRAWAARVAKQIRARYDPGQTRFVVLAGKDYRAHLFEPRGEFTYSAPLEGLGIGEQKRWLKTKLQALSK